MVNIIVAFPKIENGKKIKNILVNMGFVSARSAPLAARRSNMQICWRKALWSVQAG